MSITTFGAGGVPTGSGSSVIANDLNVVHDDTLTGRGNEKSPLSVSGVPGSEKFPVVQTTITHDQTVTALANKINSYLNQGKNLTIDLPTAASVGNGGWVWISEFNNEDSNGSVTITPAGSDIIVDPSLPASQTFVALPGEDFELLLVSDGTSTWKTLPALQFAASNPGLGTVDTDGITIQGNGTSGNKIRLLAVSVDGTTITGNGSDVPLQSIPQPPLLPVVVAAEGSFVSSASVTNLIPPDQVGPIVVTFPSAVSAPGQLLALNMFNTSAATAVDAVPFAGDRINNAADGTSLNSQTLEAIFVSDGVTNWWQIANFISPNGIPVIVDGTTIAGIGVAGNPLREANTVILTGTTPGSGAGESVTLKTGGLNWVPDPNKDYTLNLTVTCRGTVSAAPVVQSFTQTLSIRKAASTITIAASSAQAQIGDAAAASWTIVCAGGPSSFTVTFTTGATTSACVVTAKLGLTEA